MKNEEAKFVLHAYRPNGADASDATFGAALEQSRQDPALARWFTAQQAFDRAVSAKISELAPPADLRAAILAGARASRPPIPIARPWWRNPWPLALAASLALMLSLGITFWPAQVSAAEIADFAIADVTKRKHEAPHGEDAAQFQVMLGQVEQGLRGKMKVDFATLRDGGCHKLTFRGHELLEVCFKRDGNWFHCYVARAADFPLLASQLAPEFAERGAASAVAWSDGTNIYVVASRAGREALERLL